jgi:hypothetical protein
LKDDELRNFGNYIFWFTWVAAFFLLVLTFVGAETINTTVNVQTSNGMCLISTPNYFTNLNANNNYSTSFVVSNSFTCNTQNITILDAAFDVVNETFLYNYFKDMNVNCSNSDNVSLLLQQQRDNIAVDLNKLLTNNILPAQQQYDDLKKTNDGLTSMNNNLTFALNLSQLSLEQQRFMTSQVTDEKNQAWTFFFIVLGILVIIIAIFSGIFEKMGIGKPKMRV